MGKFRLNLPAIEESLRDVQRAFPQINAILQSRRDSMTDEVLENLLAAYRFVDAALASDVDLFSPHHIAALLELNHIILCGLHPQVRKEHHQHIAVTTERFYSQEAFNIDDIIRWYTKHHGESPWRRAAGVYVRILSQPQLYIEGNHRTGALIMSYILARDGHAPFVLTVDNAKAYFDPSSLVKATQKTTTTLLMKLPHMKKRFAHFLREQEKRHYLYTVELPSPSW
jgi:hypothetical protein